MMIPEQRIVSGSLRVATALCMVWTSASCAADTHPNLSGFWEPRSDSVQKPHAPSYSKAGLDELKKPNKLTDPNGIDESGANCLPLAQPWNLYQSAPLDIVQDERETTMVYEDRSLPWHV
jgi:hypothetical protein